MLGNLAWRLVHNPDCFLACVLFGKYYHSSPFLTMICSTTASHGWRSLLACLDLHKKQLFKVIGNGETTHTWKDSWISSSEHIIPYGPTMEFQSDLVVSYLLTRVSILWNKQQVELLFPETAHLIYLIQPSRLNAEDSFAWQRMKSGVYSVRSGYHTFINDRPSRAILTPADPSFKWY